MSLLLRLDAKSRLLRDKERALVEEITKISDQVLQSQGGREGERIKILIMKQYNLRSFVSLQCLTETIIIRNGVRLMD